MPDLGILYASKTDALQAGGRVISERDLSNSSNVDRVSRIFSPEIVLYDTLSRQSSGGHVCNKKRNEKVKRIEQDLKNGMATYGSSAPVNCPRLSA